MQELKRLILTKLQFIQQFKQKKFQTPLNTVRTCSELIHILLIEKKKQNLNQSIQSKIIQTIMTNKIQAPYRLMQFYQLSKNIMKNYDAQFLSESDSEESQRFVLKKQKGKGTNKTSQKQHVSSIQKVAEQEMQKQTHNPPTSQIHQPAAQLSQTNLQQQQKFVAQRHLSSIILNKKQLLYKIVKLYSDFFIMQKSEQKSQQIIHIYKKKLCQQSFLLPTLLCWLNDWINKEFNIFLKNQINQITKAKQKTIDKFQNNRYKDNNQNKNNKSITIDNSSNPPQTTTEKNLSVIPTLQSHTNNHTLKYRKFKHKNLPTKPTISTDITSLNQINQLCKNIHSQKSKQDLYEKIELIKKKSIECLSTRLKQMSDDNKRKQNQNIKSMVTQENRTNKALEISTEMREIDLFQNRTLQKRPNLTINHYLDGQQTVLSKIFQQKSNLLPSTSNFQSRLNNRYSSFSQYQEQQKQQIFLVNRQILIGAFYQRFSALYKNLQPVLQGLDCQYIKRIRKNDKKQQIKKKIKQISRIFSKNQVLIKNSIDQYEFNYHERKKKHLFRKQKNKNKFKHLKSQSITLSNDRQILSQQYMGVEEQNSMSNRLRNIKLINTSVSIGVERGEKQIVNKGQLIRNLQQQRRQNAIVDFQEKQKSYSSYQQPSPSSCHKLNNPIKFQLNLPQIPQKHRQNIKTKTKRQVSKIVIIQSGRYKFIDFNEENIVKQGTSSYFPSKKVNTKNNALSVNVRTPSHSKNQIKTIEPQIDISQKPTNPKTYHNKSSISILQTISQKMNKRRRQMPSQSQSSSKQQQYLSSMTKNKKLLNTILTKGIISQQSVAIGSQQNSQYISTSTRQSPSEITKKKYQTRRRNKKFYSVAQPQQQPNCLFQTNINIKDQNNQRGQNNSNMNFINKYINSSKSNFFEEDKHEITGWGQGDQTPILIDQ